MRAYHQDHPTLGDWDAPPAVVRMIGVRDRVSHALHGLGTVVHQDRGATQVRFDHHDSLITFIGSAFQELQPAEETGSGDFSIGGLLWPGLSKLIEECGEVMQVGGKLIGSEGRTDHWSGDLAKMLVEEIGDLQAALRFFVMKNAIDQAAVQRRADHKLMTFLAWHRDGVEARRAAG